MSNYIGVRCPICSKKFSEADDIVVCPVCGAPHHRDCYAKGNQCAFAEDHLSGKVWSDPAGTIPPGEPGSSGDTTGCPRCGASNPRDAIFCQVCGTAMHMEQRGHGPEADGQQQWTFPGHEVRIDPISMAYGGLPPDTEIEGESVRDLAKYVGSGSAYYLPRFQIIGENARAISANFAAMFFSFLFYFYRKMYGVGLFLLAVFLIGSIPSYLMTWEYLPEYMRLMGIAVGGEVNQAAVDHFVRLGNITQGIAFAISAVTSLFANRYYRGRVVGEVRRIREANSRDGAPIKDYGPMLAAKGGNNKIAVIVTILGIFTVQTIVSAVMVYYRMLV